MENKCDYCNKKIKTKYNLDMHIKAIHSIDEDDVKYCTICGLLKSFDEFYKTKYNTYRSKCKECFKKENNEQSSCELCGKWITKRYMKRHLKNKHNVL